MFRSIIVTLALLGAPAAAFVAGPASTARATTARPAMNGWEPDEGAFCWGLPGSLDPAPNFDPLGLSSGLELGEMKRYREAEVTHGRVAMLAALGFLVGEKFHPLFGLDGKEILGIYGLQEVRQVFPEFFELLFVTIGILETGRALIGWVNPIERDAVTKPDLLNADYYPGDIGFDPLGLKPTDPTEFATMQTKELQQGRLAMLGIAGMVAQELVDKKPILLEDFAIGMGLPA